MAIETVITTILIGLGVGAAGALLAKVAGTDPFDPRRFASAIVIGAIAGLGVVEGLEGRIVNETNLTTVIVSILGLSFLGSKSVTALSKLKPKTKK